MSNVMAAIFFRLAVISMAIGVTGCGEDKAGRLAAEVEQSRSTIAMLNSEKNQLIDQISRLQSDYDDLRSDYENLKVKETELSQWCRQMAEDFGPGIWFVGKDERPLPQQSIPNATAARLIDELNRMFKQSQLPQVILVQLNGDTAVVRISNEQQLTQQMGSTGATSYLQAVTYTLTSLPGIDYVEFDFQEGDHAAPGRYSR
jgi:hypothetical protein